MKNIIYITALILVPSLIWSQNQYAVNKNSGTVKFLGIDNLEIEGYDGSEVVFLNNSQNSKQNSRIKGLKIINSLGLNDNSGIGLSIIEEGEAVTVQQISNGASCSCDDGYTVKIPRNLNVYVEHSTTYGDDVQIKNIGGEIEISVNYNDVILEDVSGPLAVKTVYGNVDASFDQLNQASPSSLVSVYGHVDVSLPASSKANLQVSTNYGALYSDLDIKVQTSDVKGNNHVGSTKKVSGTVNGGGVKLSLSAMYDDVYVRKTN